MATHPLFSRLFLPLVSASYLICHQLERRKHLYFDSQCTLHGQALQLQEAFS